MAPGRFFCYVLIPTPPEEVAAKQSPGENTKLMTHKNAAKFAPPSVWPTM